MGLIYAYPEYPDANYETSKNFFNKLIREYPKSVLKSQTAIWISLLNQILENEHEIDKKWYLVDAQDRILGRLASQIAIRLRGKHKPTYTPHVDCGDYVIIVNADF